MLYPRRILILFLSLILSAGIGAKAKKGDSEKKDKSAENAHNVSIKSQKFEPATITVKPGETVTWKNDDDHDHAVVASDDSFKSGNLSHGETFEQKFETKGKFKYTCSYHPREKGTVVVTDEEESPKNKKK